MPKIKKFFVQFNSDRNKKISFTDIDDSLTVKELKEKIIDLEGSGKGQVSTLVYGSKPMKDDKTLAFYGVKKLRTIFATFKLHGGTSEPVKSVDTNAMKKINVLTSSHKCGLNGAYESCNSSSTQRMKLPVCVRKNSNKNCWYCYKCLQDTITRAVGEQHTSVQCGNKCGILDFDRLLECCHFTEDEEADLLYKYDKNQLEKKGIKDCPGCKNYVTKPKEIKGNRVRCPNNSCEWNNKDYCFLCSKQWKNSNDNDKCGDSDCEDDYAMFAKSQLEECGTRNYKWNETVGTIEDIPLIRMCPNPNCHVLIEWEDACKHITCYRCEHGYCQSCLEAWYSCRCNFCQESKPNKKCNLDTKCTPKKRQDVFELLGI